MNKLNKVTQDVSKIQVATTITTKYKIISLCILKDKRLVSGDFYGSIEVYDKSYQTQFHIEHAHDDGVLSLCALRNGELLSGGKDNLIKVWRINQDDFYIIDTLYGHTESVWKIIELKDGRISSCSDNEIRIRNDYRCIKTLKVYSLISIIEMNNFIISSHGPLLRIWDESTYECIQTIKSVKCLSENGLAKLNDNTVIVGGDSVIYLVDIKTYQINQFQDKSLGNIWCLYANGDGLVLIGNREGEILCYDSSSNQIIFKNKFHNEGIECIIGIEDNKLISSSYAHTIKIYN